MRKILYKDIVQDITRKLQSGELSPGDRIDSIREICAKYGVSAIVALRVFRELTKARLIVKREGEGYFAAAGSDFAPCRNVVCVFRPLRENREDDNFGNQVLYGIMNEALSSHFHLILPESNMLLRSRRPDDHDVKLIADEIFSFPDRAGILLDMRLNDNQIRKYILPRAGNTPVILIGRQTTLPIGSSCLPYEEIGYQTANMSFKLGCSIFILCVNGNGSFANQNILESSFCSKLKELGIPEEKIIHCCNILGIGPEYDREEFRQIRTIIQNAAGKRVFCFCGSDYICRAVYDALEKDGILAGRDYSLMGLGGMAMARSHNPKLATAAINVSELGANAVRLILKKAPQRLMADFSVQFNDTL